MATGRGPRAHTSGQPSNRPRQTTPHSAHEHADAPARMGWSHPVRIWEPNSWQSPIGPSYLATCENSAHMPLGATGITGIGSGSILGTI